MFPRTGKDNRFNPKTSTKSLCSLLRIVHNCAQGLENGFIFKAELMWNCSTNNSHLPGDIGFSSEL